ncbi:MAG: sulfite exporter TauE/SafE family protein [Chlamydiales bacterium]|nr:sulfite exporter TauE/SafE family protein [Chlamydiales bacterium]
MEYFIICLSSLLVSILTLFSGFGLATILMPLFALFFPLQIAIAATAIVHLFNSIFKAFLVGKFANKAIVIKFAIPALIASAIGAYLLGATSNLHALYSYKLQGLKFSITPISALIGIIIILSAIFELIPKLSKISFDQKYIPIGGLVSGFFGGLSGNQGMFRSAFLIRSGLKKEEFIGTSVLCSIVVDVVRITIYGWIIYSQQFATLLSHEMQNLLIVACAAAFIGSYIGSKLMHYSSLKMIQFIVGLMLLLMGFAMALGLIKPS